MDYHIWIFFQCEPRGQLAQKEWFDSILEANQGKLAQKEWFDRFWKKEKGAIKLHPKNKRLEATFFSTPTFLDAGLSQPNQTTLFGQVDPQRQPQ